MLAAATDPAMIGIVAATHGDRYILDRPRRHPIIHPARNRIVSNHPTYRYLADEQPPAPASPSALGKAFASLRVSHWSWSGQVDIGTMSFGKNLREIISSKLRSSSKGTLDI